MDFSFLLGCAIFLLKSVLRNG
uniref:Uncharacterized protein n=1 Tax=Anguilla anguilla TaxID=7936 RepID=A0A0E9SF12_ANGAN